MNDQELTVVAFDPGGKTGYAILSLPEHALTNTKIPLHNLITHKVYGEINYAICGKGVEHAVGRGHGEVNWLGEFYTANQMVDIAFGYNDCVAVIEEYTLEQNNKHTDLLLPVRIMSSFIAIYLNIRTDSVEKIFFSRRVDAKTQCTDARLKHWGLYDRNSGPHARDAMRHAFHFLRRCRGDAMAARELRFRAWPNIYPDPQVQKKPLRKKQQGERIMGLN